MAQGASMKSMQTKEVKNGRLAMMGFLGCIVQAGCQLKHITLVLIA
jgi:hypothetical protein